MKFKVLLDYEPQFFSCFSFLICTLYTTNVWFVQFQIKRIIKYWWENRDHIFKLLCSLKESWNFDHIFCLFRIIQNLGNKGTMTIIREMCEYNL